PPPASYTDTRATPKPDQSRLLEAERETAAPSVAVVIFTAEHPVVVNIHREGRAQLRADARPDQRGIAADSRSKCRQNRSGPGSQPRIDRKSLIIIFVQPLGAHLRPENHACVPRFDVVAGP